MDMKDDGRREEGDCDMKEQPKVATGLSIYFRALPYLRPMASMGSPEMTNEEGWVGSCGQVDHPDSESGLQGVALQIQDAGADADADAGAGAGAGTKDGNGY
ncbi:hypothetical protein MBM_09414 [Drepanopeziza brunnea f. sp. 'multigermtubi' MB_m1]|uniref:Uncharacterized protein n=1 Tax=Marssonina brunnea f. sp. multigermtubi (strain MB_m1) TaxID=1072389 RepID=K1W602_MARBU|nr:uncharacterized protein MBM_09414 [Drepanopeziza brunnea f. sp. 'multigermtubi' MB_m1]EKD12380.1 hypothetical protein MBM_09414 [Drepanopeziza brunnea f. sp. 'multigermtubi' MB_m1]